MHNKNGPDKAFYFKQFQIDHDRCAMKVGTDGVLLGAWCDVANATNVLDIGTGSGIIALMIAQRSGVDTKIDAVEIDSASAKQAEENFKKSIWADRLTVHALSAQEFAPAYQFNLIVSNPPYFNNSLKPTRQNRSNARHSNLLSPEDLLKTTRRLLSEDGKLSLVLPFREGNEFIISAAKLGMYCGRYTVVRSREEKPPERLLLEFSAQSSNRKQDELVLLAKSGEKTAAYKKLVEDFYL